VLASRPQLSDKVKTELIEWAKCIAAAVAIAVFIMVFIGRSTVVDGSSMEPTLSDRDRLWLDKLTYRFSEPRRGDIVVFDMPGEKYIKRVIGLPGERVWSEDGVVYVDGKRLEEDYVLDRIRRGGDFGPVTVPEGSVFVLGDNRNNSDDSRGSVGMLDIDRIIGKVVFRYYPLTEIGVVGFEYDGD
jgi:signal peptidase I